MKRTLIAIAIALPIAGLAAATPQSALDELLAADRAFSAASAKTDLVTGLTAMFAADVVIPNPPGRFAEGKAAVVAMLRANPDNAGSQTEWTPVRGGLSADGEHGFTVGFMTLHRPDGATLALKYLAYWVKQAEGWRVAAYKRARAERSFSDEAQKIGLGPAFAQFGSADAINLGGPTDAGLVVGAENIARTVSAGQPSAGSTLVWAPDRVIVASSGDLGVTVGMIHPKTPVAGQPANFPFFTIWRRPTTSAPWRYVAE